jgi:hypothetical protein
VRRRMPDVGGWGLITPSTCLPLLRNAAACPTFHIVEEDFRFASHRRLTVEKQLCSSS